MIIKMRQKFGQIFLEYGILIAVVAAAMLVLTQLLNQSIKDKINTLEAEMAVEEYKLCISILCGDLNGDGQVDQGDATYFANYFTGGPAPECTNSSDVNGDGFQLTIADLVCLNHYLLDGSCALNCIGL